MCQIDTVPDAPTHWFDIYTINFGVGTPHMYSRFPQGHHDWVRRIGGFVIDSSNAIIAAGIFGFGGASAAEKVQTMLESEDFTLAHEVKNGIWVADLHEISCLENNRHLHTIISFDAHNIELFSRDEYLQGQCFYRGYGFDVVTWDGPAAFTTSAGLFDSNHMNLAANISAFDELSWEENQGIATPNGVAVRTVISESHHNNVLSHYYEIMEIGDEKVILAFRVSFVA